MKKQLRLGLLALGALTLCGCGDSAYTILRTNANSYSELIDRLSKVNDEPSAKKFLDPYLKNYKERIRELDEKWNKFVKDIEDDFRGKKPIISFRTEAVVGSEEWDNEARNAPGKEVASINDTREIFITFVKKISADRARMTREIARLAAVEKQLIADKVAEEKAKGVENPKVDPETICPNLIKLTDPATFTPLFINGANPRPK
jgi:hypothetical protein